MAITAAMIKELRERTGAGMMDCKKYLNQADGDMDAAIDAMRKDGQAKVAKKAGRVAAEGLICAMVTGQEGVILEVNSETDFVSRNDTFKAFVQSVAKLGLAEKCADLTSLLAAKHGDATVEEARKELVVSLGENIQVRRYDYIQTKDALACYQHGERIAVLVEYQGGDENTGRDLGMQIAAMRPAAVSGDDLDPAVLAKEEELVRHQAAESGKPAAIIDKMIVGRMKKFVNEVTLLGQSYVKDQDRSVGEWLKEAGATVHRFVRYEVGEGIEKETEEFAQEVQEQLKDRN